MLFQPIRLDLISDVDFSHNRWLFILGNMPQATGTYARYPCRIGRVQRDRGDIVLYAESVAVRDELKARLEETIKLHTSVQDGGGVFQLERLTTDVKALLYFFDQMCCLFGTSRDEVTANCDMAARVP
jgi:hypothetical protein